MKKIGGEFEISPKRLEKRDVNSSIGDYLFSSGRAALMTILEDVKINSPLIYLPYYICSSVVDACINANVKFKFYELDNNLRFPIEFESKIEKNATLLIVNYFGLQNDNIILEKIKTIRPDIVTISDQVQSMWTCEDSIADYSFTSLRKHIATPDGALVYKKGEAIKLNAFSKQNTFYTKKLEGAISKYNKENDKKYLSLFEEGEKILDNEKEITIASNIASDIYTNTNFTLIKNQRKTNYKLIYELGKKYELDFVFPFSDKNIPLCVPIRLKNRDEIRRALMQKHIFLPVHWPISNFNKQSEIAKQMAEQELSLVIDQRYSEKEMMYQIETLTELIK